MTRAADRNSDWRIVRISEVDPEQNVIQAEDDYGTVLMINTWNMPTLLQIPVVEELWVVRRRGNDWILESRYDPDDVQNPLTSLKAGDARIDIPGTLYIGTKGVKDATYGVSTYGADPYSGTTGVAIAGTTSIEGNFTASGITNLTPWLIDIDVFMTPISHVNWNNVIVNTSAVYNAYQKSSGVQNDEINFDVVLGAGTWDIEVMHAIDSDRGIYTVYLDDLNCGVFSGYTGLTLFVNSKSTISGIVISETKNYRLKLRMESKIAFSTGYYGAIQHIQLRRTAGRTAA